MIIGAGNVAMDVARTVLRHGSREVYIICNRGDSTITARKVETEYAKIDGEKIEFYKTVVEFVDEGAMLADSHVYIDENGFERAEPIAGTEQLFPVDSVIVAISQGPRSVIVSSTDGIDVKDNGLVVTDDYGRTTKEGIFASGDVVTGAKTVVEAVRVSRRVAEAIHQYVSERYR
jgi:glutamate synthase (NADPH/NADH) small chain